MGCDGGTIPKRKEIVKNKQNDQQRDKNADLSAKWQFCSLSGLRLKKPIVACQLGRLYNKDSIIEYLLESKASSSTSSSTSSTVSHIKSLKDVKELKLKEKANFDKTHQASSGNERFKAQFVCPISGLDVNGKYKFFYILSCGCVISERALKEVPNEKICILCSKSYNPELDLIVLNGDESETSKLREKIQTRKRLSKNDKRSQTKGSDQALVTKSTPSVKEVRKSEHLGETSSSSSKRHKLTAVR